MSKIELLNSNGEKIKEIKLNDKIFGIDPNDTVLYDALMVYMASKRHGNHSTKTRAEVSGGGRKPLRQKGTGNARQGSIRAVQFRKGGIAFGPKPRNYDKKQNRQERRLAIYTALSSKVIGKGIIVLDELKLKTKKTKEMVKLLDKLQLVNSKVLIVLLEKDENINLATQSLVNVKVILPKQINVYDIVNADKILFTESSLKALEEAYKNE